MEQSSLRSY